MPSFYKESCRTLSPYYLIVFPVHAKRRQETIHKCNVCRLNMQRILDSHNWRPQRSHDPRDINSAGLFRNYSGPRPRQLYEEEERGFHSEKASTIFHPHYAGGLKKRLNHQSFEISVWEKLREIYRDVITVLSKSSAFKICSVHSKTESRFKARFRKAQ